MNKLCVFLVLSVGIAAAALAQTPLSGSLRNDLTSMAASHPASMPSPALFDDAQPATKKSVGLAVLYSLILPGAGEMYADGFEAGTYPLIAEGALWLTYGSMQYYGAWIRDDARNFAVSHAGVSGTAMSDQFFVDVSNFSDTYSYNEKKLRDRSLNLVYSGSQYAWRWDTEANREQFRAQRVSSDR
ncbi:MAG TPA: hypothetical protein VK470_19740, partial [Bacteroidota bacterium]|nr:hypothetical protein [Bacteroidota bacterium]